MVKGEEIYKASERIKAYGVEAFVKSLGKTARKAAEKRHGGKAGLIKWYSKRYPEAPLTLEPKDPYTSRTQKSYWKDVKSLAKARDMPIKDTRKLLKSLKTTKNVQVRVIKSGEGFQLIMLGLYENTDKENIYYKKREEAEGHSYVHDEQDYKECLEECICEAQATLGGSGWQLIKVLKETWIRYYGREQ